MAVADRVEMMEMRVEGRPLDIRHDPLHNDDRLICVECSSQAGSSLGRHSVVTLKWEVVGRHVNIGAKFFITKRKHTLSRSVLAAVPKVTSVEAEIIILANRTLAKRQSIRGYISQIKVICKIPKRRENE